MSGSESNNSDQEIAVKMTAQEWDVVIHALEEELAQLVPPEGNWLGYAPGEEDAVAIGHVHEKLIRSVDSPDSGARGNND